MLNIPFLALRREIYDNLWIGLSDLKSEGTYEWNDGTKATGINCFNVSNSLLINC